jgi:hypothetical protein
MESGSWLGIRISFDTIKPLLDALRSNDQEEIERRRIHIAASFAHEFTHRERDEVHGNARAEIASHINQFLISPRRNEIFRHQLDHGYKAIAKARETDEWGKLDLYDKAQYAATLIILAELKGHSAVAVALENDKDPQKLVTLAALPTLLEDKEWETVRTGIIESVMSQDNDRLWERYETARKAMRAETLF